MQALHEQGLPHLVAHVAPPVGPLGCLNFLPAVLPRADVMQASKNRVCHTWLPTADYSSAHLDAWPVCRSAPSARLHRRDAGLPKEACRTWLPTADHLSAHLDACPFRR